MTQHQNNVIYIICVLMTVVDISYSYYPFIVSMVFIVSNV